MKLTLPLFLYFLIVVLTAGCDFKKKPESSVEVANVGMTAAALSDDGQYAVVGSLYNGISLWRLTDNERIFDWNHKENTATTLIAADFSPNGEWALTADAHTLVLWNTQSGEAPRYWSAPGEILSVQLSKDGQFALLGLADHTAVLFNVVRGGIVRTLNHSNRVRSVALSEDGKTALTGSEDYSAIAWDLQTGKAIARMQHNDDVQLVAISPDGSLALSMGKYDKAVIWKTENGETVGELDLNAERLKRGLKFTSARFSNDNALLLTGQPDQVATLWRIDNLKAVQSWRVKKRRAWKPSSASLLDLAFTSDPNRFKAVASNGFVFDLTL